MTKKIICDKCGKERKIEIKREWAGGIGHEMLVPMVKGARGWKRINKSDICPKCFDRVKDFIERRD